MSDPAVGQQVPDRWTAVVMSRRIKYLLAALSVFVLPLIFKDTYSRKNFTIVAISSLFGALLPGHFLSIVSLVFAVIVYQILLNWISLTQGPLGIYGIAPPPAVVIAGSVVADFRNLTAFFYLVSGFTFLVYLLVNQLVRCPGGGPLPAIREH